MLSFLLFAGALHVKFEDLKENWAPIALLATIGVTISILIVSSLIYLASRSLGVDLSPSYALVFGCLISPTDPIAVLGILKNAKVSKSLETQITGESLFNDGVGVVLFIAALSIATQSVAPDSPKDLPWVELGMFFIQEAVGGIAFGLILGYAVYRILRSIDDYKVEILTTVAAVFGGMTVASHLHFSAPLSMVVIGLFIGNQGRKSAMSKLTLKRLDDFWELIDEILNAVLFVFLGLELIVIPFNLKFLSLGFSAIFIVLLARAISIALPMSLLSRFRWTFGARTMAVMTWGGLRGGISVALALQIPDLEVRQLLLVSTYCVVVFSILVQGLTLKKLITWKTSGNAT
ncbi:MAG: sodium:proton antiporter [Chitinophagaceae bacterium]|nr:sodium:proton antiporter [Oligoflexus sp.]